MRFDRLRGRRDLPYRLGMIDGDHLDLPRAIRARERLECSDALGEDARGERGEERDGRKIAHCGGFRVELGCVTCERRVLVVDE